MKKIFSCLLVPILLLGVLCGVPFAAGAAETASQATGAVYTGTTGDCRYSFDGNTGILTISGNGRMADYRQGTYGYNVAPWNAIIGASCPVNTVIIEEGVTYIGDYAFYECNQLASIYFPDSLSSTGKWFVPNSGSFHVNGRIFIRDGMSVSFVNPLYNDLSGVSFVANRGTTGACTWRLNVPGNNVLTISGEGSMGSYSSNAYSGTYSPWGKDITEVIVEDGVTNIGEGAFFDCARLNKVTIGETVQSIGFGAFKYCNALQSVVIPESTTVIYNHAFYVCPSLTSVYVLNANCRYDKGNIANEHFYNHNDDLTLYSYSYGSTRTYASNNNIRFVGELPYGRTGDCRWAREGRKLIITGNGRMGDYSAGSPAPWGTLINEAEVGEGVTYIGSYSFYQCTNLNSVILPDTVTEIGDDAFVSCPFSSLTLPAHLETIGSQAFARCINYQDVDLPDSVTEIGYGAFIGLRLPEEITIPPQLQSLPGSVFSECTGLQRVHIPAALTNISGTAFGGCSALTEITVDPQNPVYDSRGSCNAIIESATGKLICGCKTTVVPAGVTLIGDFAFYNMGAADRLVLPNSVTGILHNAFTYTGFTDVILGSGVTSVQYDAFRSSDALRHVYIPSGVTNFDNNPFRESPHVTVYGEKGSPAEQLANENALPFVPMGDADGDGKVNIKDATAIQRKLAELGEVSDSFAADVDFNNTLSINDATWLQKKLAELL